MARKKSAPVVERKKDDNRIVIEGDGVGTSRRCAHLLREQAHTRKRTASLPDKKKERSRSACRGRIRP